MTKRLIFIIIIASILIAACSTAKTPESEPTIAPESDTLTVFAAASLTDAFTEIGARFEAQHPGTQVVFNFDGSQQLAGQLVQGAPASVFASANQEQMEVAAEAGRVNQDQAFILANNQLVIIYPPQNPARVRRMHDLATNPNIQVVLGAETVPVGIYSLDFLEKASQDPEFGPEYKNNVLDNVVSYEQNVRAVLKKVQTGEADTGIVYISDVHNLASDEIGTLTIPDPLNVYARYYVAPTTESQTSALVEQFIDFLFTLEAQDILLEHGFIPVS